MPNSVTYITQEDIEKKANNLLSEFSFDFEKIDVESIARKMGLSVDYVELGDDISGAIVMNEAAATIGVNSEHSNVRQRFTLAHELGHYVLHRGQSDLFIDNKFELVFRNNKSSSGSDRLEIQANMFAAALLMPLGRISKVISNQDIDLGDDDSLKFLADYFEVSMQAMAIRLSNFFRLEDSVGAS